MPQMSLKYAHVNLHQMQNDAQYIFSNPQMLIKKIKMYICLIYW